MQPRVMPVMPAADKFPVVSSIIELSSIPTKFYEYLL